MCDGTFFARHCARDRPLLKSNMLLKISPEYIVRIVRDWREMLLHTWFNSRPGGKNKKHSSNLRSSWAVGERTPSRIMLATCISSRYPLSFAAASVGVVGENLDDMNEERVESDDRARGESFRRDRGVTTRSSSSSSRSSSSSSSGSSGSSGSSEFPSFSRRRRGPSPFALLSCVS